MGVGEGGGGNGGGPAVLALVFHNTFRGLQVIKSGRWRRRSGELFYSRMKSRPKEGDKEFNNPASRCFAVYLVHSEGLRNTRGVVALAATFLHPALPFQFGVDVNVFLGSSRQL